jgi:hypothetical protein
MCYAPLPSARFDHATLRTNIHGTPIWGKANLTQHRRTPCNATCNPRPMDASGCPLGRFYLRVPVAGMLLRFARVGQRWAVVL